MPNPGRGNDYSNEVEELVPKRDSVPVAWDHFGYRKGNKDQSDVLCKHSRKSVVVSEGNRSNLFHHLKHNHITQYNECMAKKKEADTKCTPDESSESQKQLSYR